MKSLLKFLLGCRHKLSWPITRKEKRGEKLESRTYQVCLKCGSEFEYNWREMRRMA